MYFLQKDKINEFIDRNIIALFLDIHKEVVFLKYRGKNKIIGEINGRISLIYLFNLPSKYQINKEFIKNKIDNIVVFYSKKNIYDYYNENVIKFEFKEKFIYEYGELINNPYKYILTNFIENSWDEKYEVLFDIEKKVKEHKKLYKYKAFPKIKADRNSDDDVKNIKRFQEFIDGKICYSNPKYFNDPYDCDCLLPDMESMSRLISNTLMQTNFYLRQDRYIASKKIMRVLSKYKDEESIIKDVDQIYSTILSNESGRFYQDKLKLSIDIYKNSITAIKDLKDYFKVLCLGGVYDDILMWGYYADGGNGVCCEYKEDMIRQETKRKYPQHICVYGKVKYSEEKPSYKGAYTSARDNIWQYVIDCVFTKYKKWEHEGEYRFVILCNEKEEQPYLVDVCPTEYYLGVKLKEDKIQFKKWVTRNKLKKDNDKYLLKI